MIGKLKGIIDDIGQTYIILDVHGVGYVVYLSNKTLQNLPAKGQALTLYIETQVREDAIRLFGFASAAEQEWFTLLQNVQGVGAKLALAILGSLSPDELSHAFALRDVTIICRAPGVGKKVAERLINELKNKLPAAAELAAPAPTAALQPTNGATATMHNAAIDAISALTNLGYSRDDAGQAVASAAKQDEAADTAELIRLGLQILAKR